MEGWHEMEAKKMVVVVNDACESPEYEGSGEVGSDLLDWLYPADLISIMG